MGKVKIIFEAISIILACIFSITGLGALFYGILDNSWNAWMPSSFLWNLASVFLWQKVLLMEKRINK